MSQWIAMFLENFPMIMTALALMCGLLSAPSRHRNKADVCLGLLFFFALGLSGVWGFIFHAFYPEMTAQFIGWSVSPFQFEVAMANLGMGLIGLFGLRANYSYRLAGTLFSACFLWGAAYGHVVQMMEFKNFASGNAGLIFYNDLILPLLLIVCLIQSRTERR